MGRGIDLAREHAPEHAQVIDDFKDQLLIVLLKRLGGKISIPVAEVDDTRRDVAVFHVENDAFQFEVRKKQ